MTERLADETLDALADYLKTSQMRASLEWTMTLSSL